MHNHPSALPGALTHDKSHWISERRDDRYAKSRIGSYPAMTDSAFDPLVPLFFGLGVWLQKLNIIYAERQRQLVYRYYSRVTLALF
jgi:hypothetical protein